MGVAFSSPLDCLLSAVCLSGTTASFAQDSCAAKNCQWRELRSLNELPPDILSFLVNDPPQGIADRDGKFNLTDVVVDRSVPSRRFVIAAISIDRVIVEIEHGGRAHYFQNLDFRSSRRHWVYQSRHNLFTKAGDLPALLNNHY